MTIHLGTVAELPAQVRTIILLGRRTSDHLRELVRLIEFRGRAAYWIERAADLQPRWFAGEEQVGVVLGTYESRPELPAVLDRLRQFDSSQKLGQLEGIAT